MTIAELKKAVASHYKIRVSDIEGRSRERVYSYPRMVVIFFARLCGYSYGAIRRAMNRDNSTINSAVHRIESLIIENGEFGAGVVKLKYQIIPVANLQGETL